MPARRMLLVALALAAVTTYGCSTFNVHKGQDRIAGVPFYGKVGKLKQATAYSRSWIELEFTFADVNGGTRSNVQTAVLRLQESTFDGTAFNAGLTAAQAEARNPNATPSTVAAAFLGGAPAIKQISIQDIVKESATDFTPTPTSLLQSLLSNVTEPITEVDYSTVYYYNARTPVFGSTSATIKLAADGSLTEASSSVDSTKLAEEIPLAEFLTKAFGLPVSAVAGTTTRELSVSVTRRGYVYTLTKLHDPTAARKQSPLAFGSEDSVVRTVLGAEGGKKESTGREATFQGSVSLPKD